MCGGERDSSTSQPECSSDRVTLMAGCLAAASHRHAHQARTQKCERRGLGSGCRRKAGGPETRCGKARERSTVVQRVEFVRHMARDRVVDGDRQKGRCGVDVTAGKGDCRQTLPDIVKDESTGHGIDKGREVDPDAACCSAGVLNYRRVAEV
jgi:hypothetical protein